MERPLKNLDDVLAGAAFMGCSILVHPDIRVRFDQVNGEPALILEPYPQLPARARTCPHAPLSGMKENPRGPEE